MVTNAPLWTTCLKITNNNSKRWTQWHNYQIYMHICNCPPPAPGQATHLLVLVSASQSWPLWQSSQKQKIYIKVVCWLLKCVNFRSSISIHLYLLPSELKDSPANSFSLIPSIHECKGTFASFILCSLLNLPLKSHPRLLRPVELRPTHEPVPSLRGWRVAQAKRKRGKEKPRQRWKQLADQFICF